MIKFIDLDKQYRMIEKDVNNRIRAVLEHGQYILGPEVKQLEETLANYVGVKQCIGVSSGTDALLVAMMALGVGLGDEVITTPFSFIATAETIVLLGAKPVFVDIDAETYNIDPEKIDAAMTSRTKAIMPVSLYGQCADFDAINTLAKKHKIAVIEDGCQSFGATYKGRKSCGLSTIGCTSFFPSKPLGGYGDAGACFTDDDELAKIMREIHLHGQDRRYHHSRIGINGRLDTIQAAVLLAKMALFPKEVDLRGQVGQQYTDMISEKCPDIKTPAIEAHNTSVYAQYTIQVNDRDEAQKRLQEQSIPTAVHYPVPLNVQPALAPNEADMPIAGEVANKVMSLPMHPYLAKEEMKKIVEWLKNS